MVSSSSTAQVKLAALKDNMLLEERGYNDLVGEGKLDEEHDEMVAVVEDDDQKDCGSEEDSNSQLVILPQLKD